MAQNDNQQQENRAFKKEDLSYAFLCFSDTEPRNL